MKKLLVVVALTLTLFSACQMPQHIAVVTSVDGNNGFCIQATNDGYIDFTDVVIYGTIHADPLTVIFSNDLGTLNMGETKSFNMSLGSGIFKDADIHVYYSF